MGSNSSTCASKYGKPLSETGFSKDNPNSSKFGKKSNNPLRSKSTVDIKDKSNSSTIKSNSCPLVFSRRGSMYKDEDGDLAHEFYVEVPSQQQGSKSTMKRVYDNLTPQGDVYYDNARLRGDSPYIVANI